MKTLASLGPILALFAASSCGGSPDGGDAESALEAELAANADEKIELASFEAKDALEGEFFGVPVCSIEYEAELEFREDGYWVLGGPHAGFELSSSETWPSEGVTRGQKRAITGAVEFAKTDDGWDARRVEIDLPGPGGSGRAKSKAPTSPLDLEAKAFIEGKILEHWVQGPDGWTTEFPLRNMLGQVMPGSPDTPYRQLRDIRFALAAEPLTETQKLNGADYRAAATFESTSERFFHRVEDWQGIQGWSPWSEAYLGTVAVERRNGQWLTSQDQLFDNLRPEAGDVP